MLVVSAQKKGPGLLKHDPYEAREVSGLTHNQSTRFQRRWQVRRRLQPPSVGVLVRNEIFKEIWGEVERLDQGISAPRSATGRSSSAT
jgi:hypothetical protein